MRVQLLESSQRELQKEKTEVAEWRSRCEMVQKELAAQVEKTEMATQAAKGMLHKVAKMETEHAKRGSDYKKVAAQLELKIVQVRKPLYTSALSLPPSPAPQTWYVRTSSRGAAAPLTGRMMELWMVCNPFLTLTSPSRGATREMSRPWH